jgi:hypothetical protein
MRASISVLDVGSTDVNEGMMAAQLKSTATHITENCENDAIVVAIKAAGRTRKREPLAGRWAFPDRRERRGGKQARAKLVGDNRGDLVVPAAGVVMLIAVDIV